MRKKKVWRYYCEFCRKAGCSGGHIANHERACTANPNRVCVMHKHCEHPQRPIDELMGVLRSHAPGKQWRQATEDLRQAASGCPACMLALIMHLTQIVPAVTLVGRDRQ